MFRSGVGVASGLSTLFYAEIKEEMKISEGGGNAEEEERIEVVYVPVDQGRNVMMNESIPKPAAFILALIWFYDTKAKD